jgi:hypothetical protein
MLIPMNAIQQTAVIDPSRRVLRLDEPLPESVSAGRVNIALFVTEKSPQKAEPAGEIAANPPDLKEFSELCERGKALNLPGEVLDADEAFDAAARRTQGAESREYRRMAARMRYYLEHRELWDEAACSVREMRDEWADPWEKAVHA